MVSSEAHKIKIILAVAVILVALVFSIPNVKAQTHIVINEFESNPQGDDAGNQWVELYNPTAGSVNLTGWKLITINGINITILNGTIIQGYYNLVTSQSIILEHINESITLRDSSNNVVDRTPIKSDPYDNSSDWSRFPNGIDTNSSSDWRFQEATRGENNGGVALGQSSMEITVTTSGQGNALFTYAGGNFQNMNTRYQSMGDSSFRASMVYVCSQLGLVSVANVSTSINQSAETMTVSMTATNFAQEVDSPTWRIDCSLAKNVYTSWNRSGNTFFLKAPTSPELPFPQTLSVQLPSEAVNIQLNPDTYVFTYQLGSTVMLETVPADKGVIIFAGVNYHSGQNILKANGSYAIGGTPGSDYQFARWETTGSISVANSISSSTTCTVSGNGTLRMIQTALTQPRSGCIIATATYGSESASEVVYMRYVRDNMIGSNEVGKAIVIGWNGFYYSWSPPVAQFIDTYDVVKPVFRVLLLPLIGTVYMTGLIYSALSSVNATGASIMAFLFSATSSTIVYLVMPSFALKIFCKRVRTHYLRVS